MQLKRLGLIVLLGILEAQGNPLETYTQSVGALNNLLTTHTDLRTFDNKKCHINVQSEWNAETKKFKINVQLIADGQGEIALFSIDAINLSEQHQSHVLMSQNPLRLNVINYSSDAFNRWTESSKQLQLSPYGIRMVDLDTESGEPINQVSCTLPELPLSAVL